MKLGIGSYTFGWAVGVNGFEPPCPMDERGLLDFASREGLGVVQICDNLALHDIELTRLADLGARALEKGIRLEVGTRRLDPDRITRYLEIARLLNAELLRVVIDDDGFHPDPKTVISILREIAPPLGKVALGIENHDRFPAQVLKQIIEAVGSDRIGICLDTANSLGAGEGIEHVLEVLGQHTINLHIKDFWVERLPHKMGFIVAGRPAGEGMLEIGDLLDSVQRHGRCKTAILELWTPPEPTVAATIEKEARWAAQSLSYLKPLFRHRYE